MYGSCQISDSTAYETGGVANVMYGSSACACAVVWRISACVVIYGGKYKFAGNNIMATSPTLSLIDVAPVIFGRIDQQIAFLQQKGLLASNKTCSCSTPMLLRPKSDISDGQIFQCPSCKTTKSIRAGSFFSKSKLPLQKWLILLYWWIRQYPVTDAAEEAQVSRETAINIYQWLREVCTTTLLTTPILLGGPQKVVQIDESLFRHKPKVRDLNL